MSVVAGLVAALTSTARQARAQDWPGDVLVGPVTPASAPSPPSAPVDPREPARRWYGQWILVTDTASLATATTVGLASRSAGVGAGVGAVGYYFGGPIVHLTRGRYGMAAASFGTRLGLVAAGGWAGMSIASTTSGSQHGLDAIGTVVEGAVVGVFAGMAAAIAIDATLFANEPAPAPPPGAPTVSLGGAPTRDGAWLGATGTF